NFFPFGPHWLRQLRVPRLSARHANCTSAPRVERCNRHTKRSNPFLLERHLGAAVFQLLLDGLGFFLGNVFLDWLGRAFDQILRLLEAKPGDLANYLDNVDLLSRVEAVERNSELSLHRRR